MIVIVVIMMIGGSEALGLFKAPLCRRFAINASSAETLQSMERPVSGWLGFGCRGLQSIFLGVTAFELPGRLISELTSHPRQREGGVNFFKIRYNKSSLKFVGSGRAGLRALRAGSRTGLQDFG